MIIPLYILSTSIENSASVFDFTLPTERLRAADADSGTLLLAIGVRALSFLLYLPPLLYLFRAAQARSPRVSPAMVGFVFLGPILFAAWVVVSNVAQTQIANDFVAQAGRGGDIYNLLDDLADDSTIASVGASLFFPAVLGILVAMVYVPLQAMRVGPPDADVRDARDGVRRFAAADRASVLAAAARRPGSPGSASRSSTACRGAAPPAWDAGVAVPWPSPGGATPSPQPALTMLSSRATRPSSSPARRTPKDHSARRERARKKKRKRRG